MTDGDPLDIEDAIARLNRGSTSVAAIASVLAEVETLRTHLSQIETRAQQIRGGLKPYARPVEIVDYLMGEQA